ncbi:RidA family protein [Planosporangium mesophilum]|uniref:Enamine deaminase RidA n=1 Tax=Planosporangium mesophilum TaxID=689768 RepID=A0A8J3TH55_9ACTN|nr:RidA family protein [Planosporangium mesophilum]NJC85875.1 RidA family protein [Planosporangium mesophilum]GII25077.1 enamine deaminase RidA [Planosporangium mesophilum]
MSNRRSIEIEGLHHGGAPIPQACLVGPLLVSSGILGQDPAGGRVPEDLTEQVAHVFANIGRVLDAAGGSVADIAKLTFFVRDRASREAINAEWLRMFPDPADRPARHTLVQELPPTIHVQCELIAYLGGVS